MSPHISTVDLDWLLQQRPGLTVLELLEHPAIQDRFVFADLVRLVYTDLAGNRCSYLVERDLKVNELPPSEELH